MKTTFVITVTVDSNHSLDATKEILLKKLNDKVEGVEVLSVLDVWNPDNSKSHDGELIDLMSASNNQIFDPLPPEEFVRLYKSESHLRQPNSRQS